MNKHRATTQCLFLMFVHPLIELLTFTKTGAILAAATISRGVQLVLDTPSKAVLVLLPHASELSNGPELTNDKMAARRLGGIALKNTIHLSLIEDGIERILFGQKLWRDFTGG